MKILMIIFMIGIMLVAGCANHTNAEFDDEMEFENLGLISSSSPASTNVIRDKELFDLIVGDTIQAPDFDKFTVVIVPVIGEITDISIERSDVVTVTLHTLQGIATYPTTMDIHFDYYVIKLPKFSGEVSISLDQKYVEVDFTVKSMEGTCGSQIEEGITQEWTDGVLVVKAVVSHNSALEVADFAEHLIYFEDGRIVFEYSTYNPSCHEGVCVVVECHTLHELTFEFKNLPQRDYEIELKEVPLVRG